MREGRPGQGPRRRLRRFMLDLACRRLHIGRARRWARDQERTGCLTWNLRLADRPVGALDRPMIHSLKPARSRYRSASLSLPSRKTAAAERLGWVSGVALAAVVTPPAKTAVLELLTAYRSSALIDWINPQALAATVFILVFFGCTTLLGLGLGALLKVTLLRERLRLSTSSALYPGPGLKGHPRLEP